MAIKYTAPFNLPYPDIDDPVRNGQAAIEGIAKGVNTALQNANIPPGNPDLNAVLARLNALEATTHKGLVKSEEIADRSVGLGANYIPVISSAITLISGRNYHVDFRMTSDTATPSMALGVELRKSATSDTSELGAKLGIASTIWTAPLSSSGKAHFMTFSWKQANTETVRLKVVSIRAVGSSLYNVAERTMHLYEDGNS